MYGRENRRNYYRILHVQPDAPGPILRSSYRALMRHLETHPDHGGDHWNAALVNEAYEVLSDPAKRAQYDETLDIEWLARQRASDGTEEASDGHDETSADGADPSAPDVERADTGHHDPSDASAEKRPGGGEPSTAPGAAGPSAPTGWPPRRPPSTPEFVTAPPVGEVKLSHCLFCGSVWAMTDAESPSVVCALCKSPLTLAEAAHLDDPGRRAERRIEREGTVRFYVEWPQPTAARGRIVDLSPVGMQFRTNSPIELYRMIKLEGPLLDAVASVANCREIGGSFAIGVQFHTLRFNQARGTFFSADA